MTVSIVFPQVSKNIEIQQQWEQKYSVSARPALPENKKRRHYLYFALALLTSSHILNIPCPDLFKRNLFLDVYFLNLLF